MRLAVVIPTLHRPGPLRDVVGDVLAQLGEGGLVVVDQSPVPSSFADPRVRVVHDPERGLPRARNRGITETSAPVVLFLDDDVRLHPGCLEAHRRAYLDPNVGGVVGRIVERSVRPNSRTVANRVGAGGRILTNLDGRGRRRIETLKGAQMSFRRAALVQAGPFDAGYRGTALLEDADMSVRVSAHGWELWYEPEAVVEHLSAPTGGVRCGDAWQTERWRFYNTGYFMARHRPGDLVRTRLTFLTVAVKRSLQWRRLAVPSLMRGMEEGIRSSRVGARTASPARSSR